jgi:hypothetical protein
MKRKRFGAWLLVSLGTLGAAGCTGNDESQPHGPDGADGGAGAESGAATGGGMGAHGGTDTYAGTGAQAGTGAHGRAGAEGGTNAEGGTVAEGGTDTEGGTVAEGGTNAEGGMDAAGGTDANGVTGAALGVTCTASSQCASASCASGVCCDTACAGLCQACSNAVKGTGADGICGNVGAGNDSCQIYASGTVCLAAYCVPDLIEHEDTFSISASTCDDTGTCTTGMLTACLPYLDCNGPVCATTCEDDSDCFDVGDARTYCDAPGGHCLTGREHGEPCTVDNQCNSGDCIAVDGGAGTCY